MAPPIPPLALLLALLISVSTAANLTSPHTIHRLDIVPAEYMPPPWNDPNSICHPPSSTSAYTAICDPSSLLSAHDIHTLDTLLSQIYAGQSPYSLITTCPSATPHGFRVALALVRRMVFDGRKLADRAETFAHQLFTRWQLDRPCPTSVLLFLSLEDQRMYIQTGRVAATYLTESRIDRVYSKMIPKLRKNRLTPALYSGLRAIAADLSRHRGPHAPSPPPSAPASAAGGGEERKYVRGGPEWWDLELVIVFWVFVAFLILACCHGVGGTEATIRKRERRALLRKLDVVKREHVAAMLPTYIPTTCPICQGDLTPPWVPTVPSLSGGGEGVGDAPPEIPTRTLRCGHSFRESCFDEENESPEDEIPKCPVCGDRGGGLSTPPSLTSSRTMDTEFRVKKLAWIYPEVLTDEVVEKLITVPPTEWPERMTEGYLKGGMQRERGLGVDSGGGFWNQWGGLLAAGGVGAALASLLGGWGGGSRRDEGAGYGEIGSGGYSGGWYGGEGAGGGGGDYRAQGYGTGWGDGSGNVTNGGGGGHGAGWGDALAGAASRFTGGGSGFGGGWGGGSYGGGSDGGGGHGTGW